MTDPSSSQPTDTHEYTLDDLSDLAGVTPRTVRYYIVEGLLPPPLTTGRNATYSQDHLDRLIAIGALKDMYLPLREIRRRLDTLTPEQMRDPAYLASLSQAIRIDSASERRYRRHRHHHDDDRESAAAYIDRIQEQTRPVFSAQPVLAAEATPGPVTTSWERIPLGDDAELLIRSSKVRSMGPELHRTIHRLRHLIERDGTTERIRR